MTDWIVLRTCGRHTLPLAESLGKAGFEVWTPAVVERKRSPHGDKRKEVRSALLPTFVFARSSQLVALSDLAKAERKAGPDFSLFHYLDRIPLIADSELEPLRMAEARKAPRQRSRQFTQGEIVRVKEGAFTGMSGVVQDSRGGYALVTFDRVVVKVAAFLLKPEQLAA